jgi:hypothetical protein
MQLTATKKLERARAALKTEQENLEDLQTKLNAAEKELETAVLNHETGGGQRARRDRLQRQVDDIRKRISETEQTIAVLERAIPNLEREAHLEKVAEELVPAYEKAKDKYMEALAQAPSTEELKSAVATITSYVEWLQECREDFLSRAQVINQVLLENDIRGLTIEDLRRDQSDVDSGPLATMLDELMEVREELEGAEDGLSDAAGSATISVIEPAPEDITEACPCGLHRLEYKGDERLWRLFETTIVGTDLTGKPVTERIELARGTTRLPWPCHEPKPVPKPQHVGNHLGEPGLPLRAPGSDAVTNKEEAHE